MEFARRPSTAHTGAPRLLDPRPDAALPSFRERLRLIAKAIRNYEIFDPSLIRFLPLAEQVLARLKAEVSA